MRADKALISSCILLFSANSSAATCSCAGVPLLNSMGTASVDGNQWLLHLIYEHHAMNELYSGTKEVKDETRRNRETESFILQLDYGINEVWSVSSMISYVEHKRKIGSSNDATTVSGVGDGLILLKYSPRKINLLSRWEYSLGFGVKVPVGVDDASQNNITLAEDMQPSSGSYSALAWAYLGYAFDQAAQKQVFFSSNYSANQENDRGYANGNELNVTAGFSYTMQDNWGVVAQLRYRTTEADERNGDTIPNTGGEWLDFVPSVQYRLNDRSALNVSLRLPLYRKLDGALQFTTSSAFNIGYSYAF